MAENIISPGVFTRENDLSFLPQGIGQIGAAIVGPTVKGPAFVPTVILRGFNEYEARFGSYSNDTYVPLTVRNYLRNAGTVTVVRVLGSGGYSIQESGLKALVITGSGDFTGSSDYANVDGKVLAVLHPSKNDDATADANSFDVSTSSILALSGSTEITAMVPFNTKRDGFGDTFCLKLNGAGFSTTKEVSASLNPSSPNYIKKALGADENNSRSGSNTYADTAYPYLCFREFSTNIDTLTTASSTAAGLSASVSMIPLPAHTWNGGTNNSGFAEGYDHAATPMIQSGFNDASGTVTDLFRVHKIADGTQTNMDCKISILNLKEPSDIDGEEQYSTFSLQVRKFGDKDKSPGVLEQYDGLNLNPDSPNYISRVIGDRYAEYNTDLQKVIIFGDYPNKSQYIRIEVMADVDNGATSPKLSPRGFAAPLDPIVSESGGTTVSILPGYVTKSEQTLNGVYSKKAYLGFDFSKKDNDYFCYPIPNKTIANSTGKFNVDAHNGHPSALWTGSLSASIDQAQASGPNADQVKFSVPFQGGFDGIGPHIVKRTGEFITDSNMQGYDLRSGKSGSAGYQKALDILENQDEYDINMLALPGVIHRLHSTVTIAAQTLVEDRADCFYVMDLTTVNDKHTEAVSQASGIDTNYAASYYPWVKILDPSKNKPVFVPPSVIVPGAIAQSDRIAAEWFAPAGLNRGVLGNVIEARTRLSQAERDVLYEGKVNPIATFPRTGVCIWGQKTLQARPTALDRINVRRLLIEVKKFIASSSRYLVFEQNTVQTRNRFLNIANPYLESIQQRQGLFAFRVQMDESNNTPDEIDRNRLIGAIFLQPTRTAEFIILDFNILPTGATFDGGGTTGGGGGGGY